MLMGADHLCALAVVASPGASDVDGRSASARAESSFRHAARSFILGVRWSVGHGAGLAVVCAVFFATKRRLDLERLSVVADKLVGASMIALGAVSLFSLHRWRRRRAAERRHVADAHADGPDARDIHSPGVAPRLPEISLKTSETDEIASPSRSVRGVALELEAGSDAHAIAHDLDVPHTHAPADVECGKMSTSSPVGVRTGRRPASRGGVSRGQSSASGSCTASRGPAVYSPCSPRSCSRTRRDRRRTSWRFRRVHACMASFAAAFGAASDSATRAGFGDGARHSDTPARVAMALHLFAGCASIAIGTAWVALSSLGRLGDL